MKLSGFLFLCLLFSATCAAQPPCELTAKASSLLNLQIGQSPEQAQAIFGKALKIKIKKNGERTFFQNYIKKTAPDSLPGVRALYLRFFDRRLYQIEIFYDPRSDLKTLEDTRGTLSSQLNLSVSDWQIGNNRSKIKCGDLTLVADYVLNPRVELTDETVRLQVVAAREKDSK